jgi:hypothetical protein
MRILAIVQGGFGQRKVKNIRKHAPPSWRVKVCKLSSHLPPILDEPEDHLPPELPKAELVLALGESSSAMQLIPDVVRKCGAKAVIVPIDNTEWLPPGLKAQIKEELESLGAAAAFPAPFCSLTGGKDRRIKAFSEYFGKPELKVEVEDGLIKEVRVLRDAPCGNTHYVAEKLRGEGVEKASIIAQQYHHQYPCLASSIKDKYAHDNMMNRAGRIIEKEIKRNLPTAG